MLLGGVIMAQESIHPESEPTNKELRQQKREARKALYEAEKKVGKTLIENRDFVLQAERMNTKNRSPRIVANQINFVKIDGDDIIIQYGELFNGNGRNGLGGTTYKGKIKDVEMIDLGKGKAFTARIWFMCPLIPNLGIVKINISGDESRIQFWNNGKVLNFEGFYYSLENSRISQSEILDVFD
jgi:hypothetical protein